MSLQGAVKKFHEGKTPSPYYGDLPRTSAITQIENRAQNDNLVGHDSHAPGPPQDVEDVEDRNFTPMDPDPSASPIYEPESPSREQTPGEDIEDIEDRKFTPPDDSTGDILGGDLARQHVFFVQGKSDMCLVMDYDTHEFFSLKWKTLKKD